MSIRKKNWKTHSGGQPLATSARSSRRRRYVLDVNRTRCPSRVRREPNGMRLGSEEAARIPSPYGSGFPAAAGTICLGAPHAAAKGRAACIPPRGSGRRLVDPPRAAAPLRPRSPGGATTPGQACGGLSFAPAHPCGPASAYARLAWRASHRPAGRTLAATTPGQACGGLSVAPAHPFGPASAYARLAWRASHRPAGRTLAATTPGQACGGHGWPRRRKASQGSRTAPRCGQGPAVCGPPWPRSGGSALGSP